MNIFRGIFKKLTHTQNLLNCNFHREKRSFRNFVVYDKEAVARSCTVKKVFLEILQNSQENTCARVCNFIKKETLTQVFSCKFCEII